MLELEPELYVAKLTRRRVGASARRARSQGALSLARRRHAVAVYRDPERGWYCFGCRLEGSVYDLAAALWRVEPRGAGFVALRERLTSMFG